MTPGYTTLKTVNEQFCYILKIKSFRDDRLQGFLLWLSELTEGPVLNHYLHAAIDYKACDLLQRLGQCQQEYAGVNTVL